MKENSNLLNKKNESIEKDYSRTLQFIFIKATLDLFPDAKIKIQHSIGKGIFGEVSKKSELDENDIENIKKKMQELIDRDLPINKIKVAKEEAINIFKSYNMNDMEDMIIFMEI